MPPADQADQERTKSSAQLHFVIGMGVSGQFLMAVDGQIPIPETANTRRRSLRLNDLDTRGTYLVLTHSASDIHGELVAESARRYYESVVTLVTLRTFNQVSRFFDGLELVEPGIVQCHRRHPEPGASVDEYEVAGWGAVGRKP